MRVFNDLGEVRLIARLDGSVRPGVTGWANWRLTIPALAMHFRVLAPDMVGFGYTERPATSKDRSKPTSGAP